MDGFLLTQEIRKSEADRDRRLPIVAITTSILTAELDRCYEAGMDDTLGKPLDIPKLRTALRKWLPGYTPELSIGEGEEVSNKTKTPENNKDQIANTGSIEPSALKSIFGNDNDMFKEILTNFVEPSTVIVKEICEGVDGHIAKGVADAAHKLKSASRSVGANELADMCQALEAAGKTCMCRSNSAVICRDGLLWLFS